MNHILGLSSLIIILTLLSIGSSFILSTHQGFKKCFSADVSPDKTLEVRFGFPRRERQNCRVKLEIALKNSRNSNNQLQDKKFYDGQFKCYEMNPREPHVFKHTPSQDQFAATYQICVQNLADYGNNQSMIELTISEKYDPVLYEDAFENIPLVESSSLLQIEEMVMSIKKSLSYCQKHIDDAQTYGNKLDRQIKQANSLTNSLVYLQILVLIGYGVVWMIFVWFMHKKWRR